MTAFIPITDRPVTPTPGIDDPRPRESGAHRRTGVDELDCLRSILAPGLLHAARRSADHIGTGADQILIRHGVINEDAYLARLSHDTGFPVDTLTGFARADSPMSDADLLNAATTGMLAFRREDGVLIWVVAPRYLAAGRLARLAAAYGNLDGRLRLTSTARLQQFMTQQAHAEMAYAATQKLRDDPRQLSAAPVSASTGRWTERMMRAIGVLALFMTPAALYGQSATDVLTFWFLTFFTLRMVGCLGAARHPFPPPLPRMHDDQLPIYTLMVALYREAACVAPLLRALNALDYPRAKLDIIFVVEPNDLETRAAIARQGRVPNLQVVIATAEGPQTKPKALNFALPFVRGSFVAVYDAEDRPEPGQLRGALDAFRANAGDVVCAQASLCIDNQTHSLLSRMFAAEYAGQFDVFLPGMARLGLPLPLGGTSNHFRTRILREVGCWDAFNVTEDADLGYRFSRFGYRSVMFPSTTFEEAPIAFGIWLRQRTRWTKGWMQTWQVHMRRPYRLWREMGPSAFLSLNIMLGGYVLSALAYPLMIWVVLSHLFGELFLSPPLPFSFAWPMPLHLATLVAGLISSIVIGTIGLAKRGRVQDSWILWLSVFYWACLSLAAWRALGQFIWNPYHWEKTTHGLAQRRSGKEGQTDTVQHSTRHQPQRHASANGRLRDSA